MPARYRTRVCAACAARRPTEEMRRCRTVSRWVCLACPEPARAGSTSTDPARRCALCDRPAQSHGLCHTHGERWRRWGKPALAEWIAAFRAGRLCTCSECGNPFNGHKGSVVCSITCKEVRGARLILEKWHSLDEEGKRAWQKKVIQYTKAKRARKRTVLVCPMCQVEFVGFPHRVLCGRPGCASAYATWKSNEFRQRQAELDLARLAANLESKHEQHDSGPRPG